MKHQLNITWLLTGLGPMKSMESDGGIDLQVQNAVNQLCKELDIRLPPRKVEHICKVISRDYERRQIIDRELIRDMVS